MPGRAIGVQWFSVDRGAKTLNVELQPPALHSAEYDLAYPGQGLRACAAGEEARVVVAAVDVGILNLTNYKPPSPDDYYLGQQALSAEIRDLYGELIDGMQGARGQIRSGGDQGAELQGSPPTGPPVALYSGIVKVGADGNADVAFDIADFAGTVRVMAVGLEQGQSRPRHDRCDRARSGGSVGDAAALPAAGRPLVGASRSRQCRRSGRRLHHRRDERRRAFSNFDAETDIARERARRRERAACRQRPPATAPCG